MSVEFSSEVKKRSNTNIYQLTSHLPSSQASVSKWPLTLPLTISVIYRKWVSQRSIRVKWLLNGASRTNCVLKWVNKCTIYWSVHCTVYSRRTILKACAKLCIDAALQLGTVEKLGLSSRTRSVEHLPQSVQSADTVRQFRRLLKTHYFQLHFGLN